MSQDFKSNLPQGTSDKPSGSKKKPKSHLELVISNKGPVQGIPALSNPLSSNGAFTSDVRNIGSDIYEMKIHDPFHDLGCDLILEIEKGIEQTAAVCHFPVILNESNRFLDTDEMLYGIIMIQFQMKILRQLFQFCTNHNASQLIIYMDDAQAQGFGIYHDFLVHCDEPLTENGEQTEMVIPVSQERFDAWLDFMKEMSIKCRQDLWRAQRFNPVIRRYLKSSPPD